MFDETKTDARRPNRPIPDLMLGFAAMLGVVVLGVACGSSDNAAQELGTLTQDLDKMESSLRNDGDREQVCVDYASVCERAASICLRAGSSSRERCRDITSRCDKNLQRYCKDTDLTPDSGQQPDAGSAGQDSGVDDSGAEYIDPDAGLADAGQQTDTASIPDASHDDAATDPDANVSQQSDSGEPCYARRACSPSCLDQAATSGICVNLPSDQCYADAICERQPNGECGWPPTPELEDCLNSHQ